MTTNPMEFGAKQAVINCLKVKKGEKVVVITDREAEKVADAIIAEAKKVGGEIQKFVMEDFGPRPDDGKNPLKLPKQISDALHKTQVSIYAAHGKPGEIQSFRTPMLEIAIETKLRHAHMVGITEEMMGMGMAADYSKVQALCKKVHDIVAQAREIRVTAPGGSDFTAIFDPKYKWDVADGTIEPGKWRNLPSGEVYGVPVSANGRVTVDGCFSDFFNKKYGDIEATPLCYELKDGRCVKGSVVCENPALKKDFEEYTFNTDENSDRLGEFGIGTNTGVTRLVGNMLQDEKFPGVHLALGDPATYVTGAEWKSAAHNDGIIKSPTVVVDGKMIMKDGKFTI